MKKFVVKAFIIEENKAQAEALRLLIEGFQASKPYQIDVTFVEDVEGFLNSVHACDEIVFISVEQPERNGIELARHLRNRDEEVVIALTSRNEKAALEGFTLRADGYLLKNTDLATFTRGMEAIVKRLHSKLIKNNIAVGCKEQEWLSYVSVLVEQE